jgi:hypothetical protein
MNELQYFSILDDHAEYRPTGQVSLEQMVELVTSAIAFAHDQQQRKLLVVTSGITGFKPPTLATRYYFIQKWASVANGVVILAIVARPEMIEPQKFGVTVAANRGLRSNIFESEEEALAWLKSRE